MDYYTVKLNIPKKQEAAVRSLVPEGHPVAGSLLAVLLDVAASRGAAPERVDPTSAEAAHRMQRRIGVLERKVTDLSDRLDTLTREVVR